ncbi:MAG TPA: tRNA lysidine(34) synthetase TilS [Gammaproteobacteria bacterium]|nr:tRNA lysidine(34) synthetase TilS [Gammaproteobacteria bacterium]
MAFSPDNLIQILRGLPAARRYWVALSGGLDSMVLLTALAVERGGLPGELKALHVNHGLNPKADAWQRHCETACASLRIPLEARRVVVRPGAGESLEAVARERRYAAFRELLGADDLLLLAQHEDDQLETFLLQALRGAGVRGLAAMPETANFAGLKLARPLLSYGRAELETWARQQDLHWVEDPSNADTGFDRNYLRHEVLPRLKQRWPAAAETVSRSARFAAEADELLKELAAEDAARFRAGETLPLKALQELSAPRARNLLRHWVHARGLPLPPAQKLEQILRQAEARADRNPCIDWEGAEVRRYRQRLYALPPVPEAPEGFSLRPGIAHDLGPGLGVLKLVPAAGEGLRASLCGPQGLAIAFRQGGESCQPAGRAHERPLKKWLQELHVVPWLRDRLPLVQGERGLLAVGGLFVCEPHAARPGEPGLRIEWLEHPPLR